MELWSAVKMISEIKEMELREINVTNIIEIGNERS